MNFMGVTEASALLVRFLRHQLSLVIQPFSTANCALGIWGIESGPISIL
jgi:hypothetical protein